MNRLDIVGCIPGGWYGNNPDKFSKGKGNVVIDVRCVAQALTFLRRRAIIDSTHGVDATAGAGVLIAYHLKGNS